MFRKQIRPLSGSALTATCHNHPSVKLLLLLLSKRSCFDKMSIWYLSLFRIPFLKQWIGVIPKISSIPILENPKRHQRARLPVVKTYVFVFCLHIIRRTCMHCSLFHFKAVWFSSSVSVGSAPVKTEYVFPVETLMVSRRGTSRSSTRNWTFLPEKNE